MRPLASADNALEVARALIRGERAQSTFEYAAVTVGFLSLMAAIAALWHAAADGRLTELAADGASHGIGQGTVALLKDVLVF